MKKNHNRKVLKSGFIVSLTKMRNLSKIICIFTNMTKEHKGAHSLRITQV